MSCQNVCKSMSYMPFVMCIYSSVLTRCNENYMLVCVRESEDPHVDAMSGNQLYFCPHVILFNLTATVR